MYFRQRLFSADPSFDDPTWICWALSNYQHMQVCGCVDVAMRKVEGSASLRHFYEAARAEQAAELSDTAWAFMKNIRGTAAYWSDVSKDVFAMISHLGAATWFFTFSANDLGWEDLAAVLCVRLRHIANLLPVIVGNAVHMYSICEYHNTHALPP